MSEDHFDKYEHYNYDQDKHVNMSGHSGKQLLKEYFKILLMSEYCSDYN